MSARHLSRSIVLQALFSWDFNKENSPNIRDVINYSIENFASGLDDHSFIEKLIQGIFEKREELDKIISHAAPEWPLDQIAIIDRNVLRMGLYELLFGESKEVPPKVAINEAIELAKSFGGETSGRFVNGVLGAVYNEVEDKIEKREESIPREYFGGAVVYKNENDKIAFALVHDIFGYWTLSKGSLKEGETLEGGIKKEVQDELGVEIDLKEDLGANEYAAYDPKKGKILKSVTYFLAEAKNFDLKLGDSEGLNNVKWFFPEELASLNIYNDIFPFLTKAIKILTEKKIK